MAGCGKCVAMMLFTLGGCLATMLLCDLRCVTVGVRWWQVTCAEAMT